MSMKTINTLRQQRATVWDKAKAFLDEHRGDNGLISAEDTTIYEKMESEVVALGKEIERLERIAEMDRTLSAPTTSALKQKPETHGIVEDKQGRASNAYKAAFWDAMRNKQSSYNVQNALQISQDTEGGFLIPDEYERQLVQKLEEENIMRGLCHIISTSFGDRKIPVVATKGTATWLDEGATYTESDDSFGQVTLGAYKLGTMIKISDELMRDSLFDLESYIATEFARRIGSAEEDSFLNGNGTGKPTGLLNGTGGAEVGVTAASATAITVDEIMDLMYSLRAPYRRNAVFILNDATVKGIRKLKDSNGQFLWSPSLQAGQPDLLLGKRMVTSSFMPAIEAGNKTILYGDYRNYWVADRQGRSFQRLNELYATQGQIGFKASQRVDGRLILSESVKVLQQKAV